ncbi:flavodoxin-dependent (E)-4-hydroxy-3-methylbut-2-enyl-diphosphate synthase [bacterium]|nr:flavodoxin-dependent (E)-4-hydroxy-3-methylbut-2-enyl-diphosphate synthase [bacterium]
MTVKKHAVAAFRRRKTREVRAGSLVIGGDSPVSVQSMTNTKTEDAEATIRQILRLEKAGCELVRVAVPTAEAADSLREIRQAIHIPLVADIHFDYRLALKAIENGADKIRINPGNIGGKDRVRRILDAAREMKIPVRIGVNSGSLEKALVRKHRGVTAQGLVESALGHVAICEAFGFTDLVLSIKASSVPLMIETNRLLSKKVDYPIHLGVTEAGTPASGILRSAVGIGTLLAEGIGDTIRVSLTGDPEKEIEAGYQILKSLQFRKRGVTLISCPTCGRTEVDLEKTALKIEKAVGRIRTPLTVAVMGCAVNGPGEAREADIGVAFGRGSALLFKKGMIVKKIRADEAADALIREIRSWDRSVREQGHIPARPKGVRGR